MCRDSHRNHKWFIIIIVMSGILTGTLAGVILHSCRDTGSRGDAVQTYETVADKSDSNMHVLLYMGETSDTITVSWKGHTNGTSYFRYGKSAGEVQRAAYIEADSEKVFEEKYVRNSVTISGLQAGEKYFYEISSGREVEWSGNFKAPDDSRKTSFIYMGDVQVKSGDYEQWAAGLETLYKQSSDVGFAIIGGDIVNKATSRKQWEGFFESSGIFSQLPLMTVPGNHEGAGSNNTYKKIFAMPMNGPDIEVLKESFYYSDQGSCRFIMMDSSFLTDERKNTLGKAEWDKCETAVEEWLEAVLESSEKTWNIVVIHHPPYGLHDRDTVSPEIREKWIPAMENGGVDLVLSGHQHVYMRSHRMNGITYVIGNSGDMESRYYTGNNAPLYAKQVINGGYNYQVVTADYKTLKLICVNKEGSVIDEALIEKESRFHIFELFGGNKIIV